MKKSFFLLISALILLCCRKEGCEYENCVPTCNLLDDFENYQPGSVGNWQKMDNEGIAITPIFGSNMLQLTDDSGASYVYNTVDFPKNLLTGGCALRFDMAYNAGAFNVTNAATTIRIFQGPNPLAATAQAYFVLNPAHEIISGNTPANIEIPLELASGTTLPSNSFGKWVLAGASSPTTATDVANFNALIQNISGVYFGLDNGSNPVEVWYYDNFCFKQCCKIDN